MAYDQENEENQQQYNKLIKKYQLHRPQLQCSSFLHLSAQYLCNFLNGYILIFNMFEISGSGVRVAGWDYNLRIIGVFTKQISRADGFQVGSFNNKHSRTYC